MCPLGICGLYKLILFHHPLDFLNGAIGTISFDNSNGLSVIHQCDTSSCVVIPPLITEVKSRELCS